MATYGVPYQVHKAPRPQLRTCLPKAWPKEMHFLGHLHISSNSGLRNHGSWSAKKEGTGGNPLLQVCKALKRGCVAGLLAGLQAAP